jgi:hypothetical protein
VTIGIRESIDRLNIQFCAGKKEHEVNNNSVYISRDKNEKLLNVKKVDKPNTLKLSFYFFHVSSRIMDCAKKLRKNKFQLVFSVKRNLKTAPYRSPCGEENDVNDNFLFLSLVIKMRKKKTKIVNAPNTLKIKMSVD